MARLPVGQTAPDDGQLPPENLARLRASGEMSLYIHVPYCAVRCGYCDFNTYVNTELGPGASPEDYPDMVGRELALAHRVLSAAPDQGSAAGMPIISTIFFGGGTPTLIGAEALAGIISSVSDYFEIAPDVEITVEANPDSIDAAGLATLRAAGVTRMSFGMQSAVPKVLKILDRTHNPEQIPLITAAAHELGMQTSLDLIYATPGESDADWRRSLQTALACDVGHISAYALGIEPGTKMGMEVRRGKLPPIDDDIAAHRYRMADEILSEAGMHWYEVSNWARSEAQRCRHNLAYWRNRSWWGIGPGAHSHISGVRWWNALHPRVWSARLREGLSPALGREIPTRGQTHLEEVMLRIRLREGMHPAPFDPQIVTDLESDGLIERIGDMIVLTLRGRLLADAVTRALT